MAFLDDARHFSQTTQYDHPREWSRQQIKLALVAFCLAFSATTAALFLAL